MNVIYIIVINKCLYWVMYDTSISNICIINLIYFIKLRENYHIVYYYKITKESEEVNLN